MAGAGDEMFADSYPMREIEDGFFYEVDGSVSIFWPVPSPLFAALAARCSAACDVSAMLGAVCTSPCSGVLSLWGAAVILYFVTLHQLEC